MRIRVPGTSANLGPGFDALGIALTIYNYYDVDVLAPGEASRIRGCPEELCGADNLFLVAYRLGMEAQGLESRPLEVRVASEIPIARGLGSSAACIVGGLLSASVIGGRLKKPSLSGRGLSAAEVLDLASSLEGHPDNVAPALLGGFRASVHAANRTTSLGCPIGPGLRFFAMVPPFPLETKTARAALPRELPFRDAVFNLGRASLVTAAFFAQDWDCLGQAFEDMLHQRFRSPLIPGYEALVAGAKASGALGVYLSGAGPTIMVVGRPEDQDLPQKLRALASEQLPQAWTCLPLGADDKGAIVEE